MFLQVFYLSALGRFSKSILLNLNFSIDKGVFSEVIGFGEAGTLDGSIDESD